MKLAPLIPACKLYFHAYMYIGLVIYSLDYNILILDLAIQVRIEQRNFYRYMKTKEKIHDKFVRFDFLILMLFAGKK